MSFHSDHPFFHKQSLESCISPKWWEKTSDIVSEIKSTRVRNDFYRYHSWKIQTANLKRQVVRKHKNFIFSIFTEESWKTIERFVEAAVEIYNKSHPCQKTTGAHALKTLKEWWQYDYEKYLLGSLVVE